MIHEIVELSIVVLNWNGAGYTRRCIETIQQYTHDIDYEIILVDNASTEQASFELLQQLEKEIKVIRNTENMGFSGGNNAGLQVARGKYLLLLNNDTEITGERWYRAMIATLENDWKIGITGPSGGYHDRGWIYAGATGQPKKIVEYIEGWCMLVRRQLYEKIGGLDEEFFLLSEDADYCCAAKAAGYKIVTSTAQVIHFGSKSLAKRNDIGLRQAEGRRILQEKWPYPVNVAKRKNILCIRYEARGDVFLTLPAVRMLRKLYPRAFIHFLTLEPCVSVIENCRDIDKIWIRSHENTGDLPALEKISFDLIINFQDHNNYPDLPCFFTRKLLQNDNPMMQNTQQSQQLRSQAHKKYIEIYAEIAEIELEPKPKLDFEILEFIRQWASQALAGKEKIIAISGDSGWPARHFGKKYLKELIAKLLDTGFSVVLLGNDPAFAGVEIDSDNFINFIGKTSVAHAVALIEKSCLLITIDSLLLHLGQCTDTPILALWSATEPSYVVSIEARVTNMLPDKNAFSCFPCFKSNCSKKSGRGAACFPAPEKVIEKVQGVLAGSAGEKWYDEAYFSGMTAAEARNHDSGIYFGIAYMLKSWGATEVLDVGCGLGYLVRHLRNLDISALGCDVSEYAVKNAVVLIHKANILSIPQNDNGFEWVTCLEVLEHIPERHIEKALSELIRVAGDKVICSICTEERPSEPSHVTVRPRRWWLEMFAKLSVTDVSADYSAKSPELFVMEKKKLCTTPNISTENFSRDEPEPKAASAGKNPRTARLACFSE